MNALFTQNIDAQAHHGKNTNGQSPTQGQKLNGDIQLILSPEQWDKLNKVKGFLWSLQYLMVPNKDLSLVDRGGLSDLLAHFTGLLSSSRDPDEKHTLQSCLGAVISLIAAEDGLEHINRDNLTTLLFYLLGHLDKALEDTYQAEPVDSFKLGGGEA